MQVGTFVMTPAGVGVLVEAKAPPRCIVEHYNGDMVTWDVMMLTAVPEKAATWAIQQAMERDEAVAMLREVQPFACAKHGVEFSGRLDELLARVDSVKGGA